MKTVPSPPGSTTGTHPGGIKTLRRGEERFANYLILRRGQVTGLTINEILHIITKQSDRPRENHGGDTVRKSRRFQNVTDSIRSSLRKN
jgi:hypothetical protein